MVFSLGFEKSRSRAGHKCEAAAALRSNEDVFQFEIFYADGTGIAKLKKTETLVRRDFWSFS